MGASSSTNSANKERVKKWINDEISSNLVVMFSKTYCPSCRKAKNAFQKAGLDNYVLYELDQRDDGDGIQDALKDITGARTVPRVFINGTFVGGGSDIEALQTKGELKPMLQSCGAM